jgi:hypothetical protein
MDINDLIVKVVGSTAAEAIETIDTAGFESRIGSEDGKEFMLTSDLRRDRLTLDMVAGKVVKATIG